MRIALFSDVHANLTALEACLRHARERGADRFAFLGDLVGYGPDPGATIDAIAAVDGAVVIKGNHDDAVEHEPRSRDLNDLAYAAIAWTRAALSLGQRAFLSALPLIVRDGAVCYVHGSADRPAAWEYLESPASARRSLDAAGTAYVFSGHVHDQVLYFGTPGGQTTPFRPTAGSPIPVPSRRRWLAIVGSVGQPRDGNPAAAYALFETAPAMLTFHRVAYDHAATASRIRAVGLPVFLAERLERGR